jgi:hypothetical protein
LLLNVTIALGPVALEVGQLDVGFGVVTTMGTGYDVVDGGRLGMWNSLVHWDEPASEDAARDLAAVAISLRNLPEGVGLGLEAPVSVLDASFLVAPATLSCLS